MRQYLIIIMSLLAITAATTARGEESEDDRLRDALRDATAQAQALEDQRVAVQNQLTAMTQERDHLKVDLQGAKARIKAVEKSHREAVAQFNQRLDERNQALDKWKSAYEEAATVARAKDAERAQFEEDAKTFKEATKTCAERNIKLVAIGHELVDRLANVHFGDILLAQEPLTGIKRVQVENLLQDYQDKILEQKAQP